MDTEIKVEKTSVEVETVTEQTDESALIARAKTDRDAFGELYQRYVGRIYNYIYYRTNNVEDAEDLTARTFQRALLHIHNYQDKGIPFSAWLYRIARNLVSNWHRDQGRRHMIALDDIVHWKSGDGSPEQLIQLIENEDQLLECIRRLPEDRQELLILKFLHRLPNSEIGEIMDRSEGAIKSLYHRTLLVLREELTAEKLPPTPTEERRARFNFRFWERDKRKAEADASATVDDEDKENLPDDDALPDGNAT